MGVASCLGLGASGALAGALAPNGGEFGLAAAPSLAAGIRNYGPRAVVAFAVWGAGLGFAQWTVVRNRIPGSGLWASMTIEAGRSRERRSGWSLVRSVGGPLPTTPVTSMRQWRCRSASWQSVCSQPPLSG